MGAGCSGMGLGDPWGAAVGSVACLGGGALAGGALAGGAAIGMELCAALWVAGLLVLRAWLQGAGGW